MGTTWDPAAPPFFHVKIQAGQPEVAGSARCSLGHRIDLGAGRRPGGNWVEWQWDGDRFELTNDRFRGYPVFYTVTDSSVAVSPSIDALLGLGADRTLDTTAIAAFLTVGFYPGDDTAFKSIKAMPPAATLTWRWGALDLTSTPPQRPQLETSRADAVTGLAELTRIAVRRSIPDDEHYEMPLSGGRDSRHILYELIAAGHLPAAHQHGRSQPARC
jgi:asparagine synthase (glutamine-hydrolysing)